MKNSTLIFTIIASLTLCQGCQLTEAIREVQTTREIIILDKSKTNEFQHNLVSTLMAQLRNGLSDTDGDFTPNGQRVHLLVVGEYHDVVAYTFRLEPSEPELLHENSEGRILEIETHFDTIQSSIEALVNSPNDYVHTDLVYAIEESARIRTLEIPTRVHLFSDCLHDIPGFKMAHFKDDPDYLNRNFSAVVQEMKWDNSLNYKGMTFNIYHSTSDNSLHWISDASAKLFKSYLQENQGASVTLNTRLH